MAWIRPLIALTPLLLAACGPQSPYGQQFNPERAKAGVHPMPARFVPAEMDDTHTLWGDPNDLFERGKAMHASKMIETSKNGGMLIAETDTYTSGRRREIDEFPDEVEERIRVTYWWVPGDRKDRWRYLYKFDGEGRVIDRDEASKLLKQWGLTTKYLGPEQAAPE